jgi:hypothetical protein
MAHMSSTAYNVIISQIQKQNINIPEARLCNAQSLLCPRVISLLPGFELYENRITQHALLYVWLLSRV